MAKKALGKGLGALIRKQSNAPEPTNSTTPVREVEGQAVQEVEIKLVVVSPFQPRKVFSDAAIEELAESIKQHGIIQPLIVRKVADSYELIAGERRWRASQSLEFTTVPVIVRDASDREVLELALIENIQRADLNAIEEALAYQRLANEFALKHEAIARQVGKSRAAVANTIRLLDLHAEVQDMLSTSIISVGHAKAILGVKDKEKQLKVAKLIVEKKYTVRGTERYIQNLNASEFSKTIDSEQKKRESSELISKLQDKLSENFASKVTINHSGKKGKIEFNYKNNIELERIIELLGVSIDEFE